MSLVRGEIFRTAAFRLSLSLSAAFSALILLLFGFVYWQTAVYETNRIDAVLINEARVLAAAPRDELIRSVGVRLANDLHRITFAALFSPDGRLIAGNLLRPPAGLAIDGKVYPVDASRFDPASRSPEPARAIALRLPDGDLLVIGRNSDELVQLRHVVLRGLLLGLAPAVLLSLLAGVVLSSRTLNHIRIIRRSLQRIMRGHIEERLPTRGTRDDLDQLVAAVNAMMDEIAALMDELRGIGDNIAHDLRMPLARLRARLERSRVQAGSQQELEAAVDQALTDLDQLAAIVAAILRIGEIENTRRQAGFAVLALDEMVRELAELFQPIADAAGIALSAHVDAPGSITGDRDLLMEAFTNLVDNALKFTPAGGSVFITCYRNPEGAPVLRVTDTGPGIPEKERQAVMKRFYRSDKSRHVPGGGLGLSLVTAIMRLHQFRLAIVGEPPGCIFEVTCTPTPGD